MFIYNIVNVIFMQPDGAKIALSMKVVNQTTGKDLDPALVQTRFVSKPSFAVMVSFWHISTNC
jgi:hypothetical protein